MTEQKQSYNYLIPKQALPRGWTDYGLATLNFSWELDFWGKNRSALAAALSDQQAAGFEYAETRLLLSTSVAAAYAGLVDLYTLRDNAAETLRLREETVKLFRQSARLWAGDARERAPGGGAAGLRRGRTAQLR